MANWKKILSRGNVEDRRTLGPAVVSGVSITGIVMYMLFNLLTTGNVEIPLDQLQSAATQNRQTLIAEHFAGADSYEVFVSAVLGSNNDFWSNEFSHVRQQYNPPKLVLFRTSTTSACGGASSQVGPHYCSLDETIYLDETFFDELTSQLGASGGDVAEAYVISHEVGHHVQNQVGTFTQTAQAAQQNRVNARELDIKLELQADCFAGLWANSIKDLDVLSPNEISEAMDAAAAVGDDHIQEKITGRINTESWTHGSSEQRVYWFTHGYESGNLSACNTFN